jgi:hypothetical protein
MHSKYSGNVRCYTTVTKDPVLGQLTKKGEMGNSHTNCAIWFTISFSNPAVSL